MNLLHKTFKRQRGNLFSFTTNTVDLNTDPVKVD